MEELSPFVAITLYRFLRTRDNARLLETTDVGELNKLIPDGFQYDPIAVGFELTINEVNYTVNNVCIFPNATLNETQNTAELIGQRFSHSVLVIIYIDD